MKQRNDAPGSIMGRDFTRLMYGEDSVQARVSTEATITSITAGHARLPPARLPPGQPDHRRLRRLRHRRRCSTRSSARSRVGRSVTGPDPQRLRQRSPSPASTTSTRTTSLRAWSGSGTAPSIVITPTATQDHGHERHSGRRRLHRAPDESPPQRRGAHLRRVLVLRSSLLVRGPLPDAVLHQRRDRRARRSA